MNWDAFDAVFDGFTYTAFRLETRSRYADDEGEDFAAFLAGRPVPERSPRTDPWLRRLADTTASGKRWQRVHIIDQPLSDYLRFELAAYPENISAGEDVRIVSRGASPELVELHRDFWLFDAGHPSAHVMLMDLDDIGHLRGFKVTSAPEIVQQCVLERDFALKHAIPFDRHYQEA
jgi:hypothetical protein